MAPIRFPNEVPLTWPSADTVMRAVASGQRLSASLRGGAGSWIKNVHEALRVVRKGASYNLDRSEAGIRQYLVHSHPLSMVYTYNHTLCKRRTHTVAPSLKVPGPPELAAPRAMARRVALGRDRDRVEGRNFKEKRCKNDGFP